MAGKKKTGKCNHRFFLYIVYEIFSYLFSNGLLKSTERFLVLRFRCFIRETELA